MRGKLFGLNMIFLIHYNRCDRTTLLLKPFAVEDRAIALNERLELELRHNTAENCAEIVVLEAKNESQLKRTHARYFHGEIEKSIAQLN